MISATTTAESLPAHPFFFRRLDYRSFRHGVLVHEIVKALSRWRVQTLFYPGRDRHSSNVLTTSPELCPCQGIKDWGSGLEESAAVFLSFRFPIYRMTANMAARRVTYLIELPNHSVPNPSLRLLTVFPKSFNISHPRTGPSSYSPK